MTRDSSTIEFEVVRKLEITGPSWKFESIFKLENDGLFDTLSRSLMKVDKKNETFLIYQILIFDSFDNNNNENKK